MQEKIVNIINEMAEFLSIAQMKKLQEVLLRQFTEKEQPSKPASNTAYLQLFLDAKRIEGCSDRTLRYYRTTNEHLLSRINTPVRQITTDQIRRYLVEYQEINHCSKVFSKFSIQLVSC